MTSEELKHMHATAFGLRESDGRLCISRKSLREFLPPGFPKIITLCGSTRFKKQYEDAAREETLAGNIVLSVGMFGHQEGIDMEGQVKKMLDELHLRKIDCSDGILVICPRVLICNLCKKPCGVLNGAASRVRSAEGSQSFSTCCETHVFQAPYIGNSTSREIEYALFKDKEIRYRNTL